MHLFAYNITVPLSHCPDMANTTQPSVGVNPLTLRKRHGRFFINITRILRGSTKIKNNNKSNHLVPLTTMDSEYLGIGTDEDTAFDNLAQLQEALQALANDTSGPCKDTVADAAAAVKRLGDLSGSDAEVDGYEWFFCSLQGHQTGTNGGELPSRQDLRGKICRSKLFRIIQSGLSNFKVVLKTYQWAIDNPIKAGLIVVGVTILVAPGLVTGPVVYGLELIGFTADGVAAGKSPRGRRR